MGIDEGRGTDADLGRLNSLLRTVTDANRCYLGTEEQVVISSILRAFPEEVAAHLEGTSPPSPPVLVPLIVDLAPDGAVSFDEHHRAKRPDWTYDD